MNNVNRFAFPQIFRKAALKIVQGADGAVEVTTENLHEYVGKPLFNSDRIYDETPAGVVMGLAWTSLGTQLCLVSLPLPFPLKSMLTPPKLMILNNKNVWTFTMNEGEGEGGK